MRNEQDNSAGRLTLATVLQRGLRLRCPVCGQGRLFRNWFRMFEKCEQCGLKFDRGPGYYLGSIYVNYGLTAAIVIAGFMTLFLTDTLSPEWRLGLLTAFCFLFPLWFFRYARSLWLAMDLYFDPGQVD
jgi:uncharacterized protein (DUF983 family)